MNGYNSKEDHLSGSNFQSPLSSGRRGKGAGGWGATLSEGIHCLLVEASLPRQPMPSTGDVFANLPYCLKYNVWNYNLVHFKVSKKQLGGP